MGDLDLKHLRALAEAATPGPWELRSDRNEQKNVYSGDKWIAVLPHQCVASIEEQRGQDAAFVAAARTAVPELLDENERLRAALDYLRRKIDGYDTTFHFAVRDERGENPIPGFEDWKADE